METVLQFLSLAGAALILGAYLALQRSWWPSDGVGFLWCNLLGAVMLTAVAAVDRRAGFVVLEAAWAVVSLASLVRRGRSTDRASPA